MGIYCNGYFTIYRSGRMVHSSKLGALESDFLDSNPAPYSLSPSAIAFCMGQVLWASVFPQSRERVVPTSPRFRDKAFRADRACRA